MKERNPITSINMHDLIIKDIPPKEMILAPIIPKQGLVMLFAARGIGKTYVSLSIAYAVATGGCFLQRWQAPKPRKVLFVDGEMSAKTLQERLQAIHASSVSAMPDPDYLQIITPDLQKDVLPDLSTAYGQDLIEKHVKDVELIILDNLSTLCLSGKENDGESWLQMQRWILNLRRQGKTVLYVHHAGKNEQQRGTSRKEDVLDTVIALRHPADYQKSEGARFEVHYEKSRGFYGDDAKSFEAQLISDNQSMQWNVKDIDDVRLEQVRLLYGEGLSMRDIQEETGIPKSTVQRLIKKIKG